MVIHKSDFFKMFYASRISPVSGVRCSLITLWAVEGNLPMWLGLFASDQECIRIGTFFCFIFLDMNYAHCRVRSVRIGMVLLFICCGLGRRALL